MNAANTFPTLLEAFFVDRLMRQRQVSPHTLASYRDTFRLLLLYAQRQLGKAPSALRLPDLDTPFLGAFLDHLEQERDNSARSRNVRLAAIHSFFRYVALHAPEHSALAQRVLAMPSKRYLRRPIDFLTPVEVAALLAAPNLDTWGGRRDRALLLLAVQTGLRASELLGLRCQDIVLGPGARRLALAHAGLSAGGERGVHHARHRAQGLRLDHPGGRRRNLELAELILARGDDARAGQDVVEVAEERVDHQELAINNLDDNTILFYISQKAISPAVNLFLVVW